MNLRDIGVAIIRPEFDREAYLRDAEHIAEIYIRFLPRKYKLDGSAKANITLGSARGKPTYSRLLNVNEYYFEEFDFASYDHASPQQKDERILAAIEHSLLDIAVRHGADAAPIREAAEAVRSCGFELKGYTKLSRFTRSRRLHIKVFQRISRAGIEWGVEIVDRSGQMLKTRCVTAKSDSWRSAHDFRRSRWVGERFEILDFQGRPKFTLNVAPLERRLLESAR